MYKQPINPWEYAGRILEQLGKGALLTVAAGGEVNTMTVGWGTLGIQWGKNICTVYVRQSRHTKKLLEENPAFTLNVPVDGSAKEILTFCGTKSGRDVDKIKALGLTTVAGETVNVPAVAQLPLTLECRVLYRQDQDADAIDAEAKARFYKNGDYHTAYYAEITAAYILKEEN